LKDFIFAFRMGTTEIMNDALCECKKNFEEYWGQKLVNVLRAIHSLLFSDALLNEDNGTISPEESPRNKNWVSKHFANQTEEDIIDDDL